MQKYGKLPTGDVVHVVLEDGTARCDRKRTSGLVPDVKLTALDCNCSKCKSYKDTRDELKAIEDETAPPEDETAPPEDETAPPSDKPKVKAKTESAPAAKKKPKPKKKPKKEAKPPPPVKQKSKSKPEKVKVKEENFVDVDFVSQQKSGGGYSIYHRPTQRIFFDNIPGDVISKAIEKLNALPERWTPNALPQGFVANYITKCRMALCDAYVDVGLEPPNKLKVAEKEKAAIEKADKKSRKIKRRKKEKRKIKRRKKQEKEKPVRKIRRREKPSAPRKIRRRKPREIKRRTSEEVKSIARLITSEEVKSIARLINCLDEAMRLISSLK